MVQSPRNAAHFPVPITSARFPALITIARFPVPINSARLHLFDTTELHVFLAFLPFFKIKNFGKNCCKFLLKNTPSRFNTFSNLNLS